MARVSLTPRARENLDNIWFHIALDSLASADRLITRIVARCQSLSKHPRLGPARPEIAPDARMLLIGDYMALYRIRPNEVQIVRVVHGARRLEGLFDQPPET